MISALDSAALPGSDVEQDLHIEPYEEPQIEAWRICSDTFWKI